MDMVPSAQLSLQNEENKLQMGVDHTSEIYSIWYTFNKFRDLKIWWG